MTTTTTPTALTGERADLATTLDRHRGFLLTTVRDLDDEQATRRTTVSELTLAGIVKHVSRMEAVWTAFAERGAAAFDRSNWSAEAWAEQWQLQPGQTVAGVVADYAQVARRTTELLATVDLDAAHALPPAPWFEPGATWTARRALLHLLAETAQHAGHADVIREALDGQKTMG